MTTPETQKSTVPENEIRVSGQTNVIRGVERVGEAFKKFDNVILSGINTGISKVLLITEIVKLKVLGLHQYNLIETIKTEKHEEDNEDKSDDNPRYSTRFKVELHKNKLSSPPKGSFYEAPYTEDEVKKISSVKPPERKGRPGTSRGGRGGFFRGGRGRGEGRGRGRGDDRRRGGRGRGEGRGGRGEGRGGRGRGGDRPRTTRGEGRGRGGRGRGDQRGRGRGEHRDEHRGETRGRGGRGDARGGKRKEAEESK